MGQGTFLENVVAESRSPLVRAEIEEARVLVVEDDEAMRAFLEESLREEGYVVRTAPNTLSGIVTLLGEPIDVLVIDWKMPDLDGFALLTAVRRCFADVPVIFVTAFARPDVARRALLEGAFAFLPKPFRLSVLVAEIERALRVGSVRVESDDRASGILRGATTPRRSPARDRRRAGPLSRTGRVASE
jgi:DNA-binding response OmpR family regulator